MAFVCCRTVRMAAVCQLKIKYDQDKFGVFFLCAKRPVNEHRVAQKSHDAKQKNCPHVVHFKVPRDCFETHSRHQKCHSEGGKKIRGCRGLLGRVIMCMKSPYSKENCELNC